MPRALDWTLLGVPVDSVAAPAGGPAFGTERAPAALRGLDLAARLGAADAGDLDVRIVGPDRDPVSGIVGWPSVATVTRTIRDAVAELVGTGRRPLLLGGCCALLMGAVAGARDALARDAGTRPGGGRLGLAYVDGHVDVYDHRTSPTGEAADMPVAALLGLGWAGLLGPLRPSPVLAGGDVVVLGARDPVEAADIGDLPRRLSLTLVGPTGIAADPEGTGSVTVERFAADALPYWLHVDLDVLDEAVFPATDYLMPGGLDLRQLAALLRPIGRDPALVGASVACYNPDKDPDGSCGAALGDLLVDVLGGARREAES